ncbi:MAG: aminotransferase class V-fold PLP-dependent enzyme [Planctomycetes bacterium]|nr:aminotransferase class V-fold PLP-dependent enzyme [Planctomycetota bacterium]
MSIFEQWGVEPIINVSGSVTRLGGAPMPKAVLDAFCAAAGESVPLDVLQGAASRVIAEATGAEAGIVTCGAAAGLMLGTAAILAGFNLGRMEALPHTEDFPHEFVAAREHRNGYDHALRAAGARFVEVGFQEIVAGAGVRRVEAWEYEAAFGPMTAGVMYVYDAHAAPPLAELVKVAHAHRLPVLVDAAGELPPRSNLKDILATGADLVVFSGGKAIRGPQSTGILCGRRVLIASALLQMLDMDDHFDLWEPPENLIDRKTLVGIPRHGIGRPLKVAKEQIAALLTALRLFASGEYDRDLTEMSRHCNDIAKALQSIQPCPVAVREIPSDGQSYPLLEVTLNSSVVKRSAFDICRALRRGKPSVQVGHLKLAQGTFVINPLHLNGERTAVLIRRLREELGGTQ